MSLIDSFMENCIIMNKAKVSDGEAGYIITWTEGASIMAAITQDTTMQARIGEKQGVTSTYTITTPKAVVLEYHDVIKRVSDGKIFRVTSDAGDKVSPAVASFDVAQVTAEKWSLTE